MKGSKEYDSAVMVGGHCCCIFVFSLGGDMENVVLSDESSHLYGNSILFLREKSSINKKTM